MGSSVKTPTVMRCALAYSKFVMVVLSSLGAEYIDFVAVFTVAVWAQVLWFQATLQLPFSVVGRLAIQSVRSRGVGPQDLPPDCASYLSAMAASLLLVPIAPEAQEELAGKISHDHSFVWNTLRVPQELQARLSQLGLFDLDVW